MAVALLLGAVCHARRMEMRILTTFLLLLVLIVSASFLATAQKTDEATRKLWDTAFIVPAAKKSTPSRRRSYRVATPNVPTDNVAPDSVVGVTIWRLRPANRSDSGERLIVH